MAKAKEVGPFHANVNPVHHGLYKRVTRHGVVLWSYFGGGVPYPYWGICSMSRSGAFANRGIPSAALGMQWYGLAQETK